MMTDISDSKKHWPQLDGLRAFAVFGVLIHHFLGHNGYVAFGLLGVQLFFVLSGFLITGILLRTRQSIEDGQLQRKEGLKIFYIRRSLRIFPIYYLVIFISWLIGDEETKNSFFWLITYLTNFHFTSQGWFNTSTAHLWTLAVEEQFYLFWPALILFTPRRALIYTIIFFILVGPIFRLYVYSSYSEINAIGGYILTLSNFDSLAMGALLAYFDASKKDYYLTINIVGLYLSLIIYVVLNVIDISSSTYYSISLLCYVMFCTWIIYKAKVGIKGFVGEILSNSIVCYIGKISYGVYLYHLFVQIFITSLFKSFGYDLYALSQVLSFTILVVCTLLISILSWQFIENPINKFKKYFVY